MEKEIPKIENAICQEIMCTKCGMMAKNFVEDRWVCSDISTRVEEAVLGKSKTLLSWQDVMQKLSRLYCLNKFELESGFQAGDEIIERTDAYCLIKDSRGLLLIVVHDQENQNYIEQVRQRIQGKPIIIALHM